MIGRVLPLWTLRKPRDLNELPSWEVRLHRPPLRGFLMQELVLRWLVLQRVGHLAMPVQDSLQKCCLDVNQYFPVQSRNKNLPFMELPEKKWREGPVCLSLLKHGRRGCRIVGLG